MKKLAVLALLFSGAFVSAGEAADTQRYNDLGVCMAFIAVDSGIDGKRDVDPSLGQTIAAIGAEFMFEATVLGYDDNTAQTFVVSKLQEMNLQVNEMGSAALKEEFGPKCKEVAISVVRALQNTN